MKTDSKSLFANLSEDIHAAVLEFVGTAFWLLLALGGIQAAAFSSQSNGDTSSVPSAIQLLYISASMGLSLLVSVWLFFRVTGGVFNPAISTALLLVGVIGPVRWVLYCIAQMVGAIAASALLLALLPGKLDIVPSPANGINSAQAVFIEAFLTAALVFAVLMLAAERNRTTPFAPIGIGLTLFAGHLWGAAFTGSAMNTARAFGPAVVVGFNKQHWVYWLGPFIGSLIATLLYSILKHIKYWRLNPDQDVPDHKLSPANPLDKIVSGNPRN
ncbi:aquaporin, Major intrinsic protein family [Ceratobasidium sp. AG-Ba]|nr:aquaporin, Major intrinsic protein family [Ceratobasidium sp. AG-Ba]